jgi:hypothetical protein
VSRDIAVAATLRRLWEQARTFIELCAGPNRLPELRRLEKLRDDLPILEGIAAVGSLGDRGCGLQCRLEDALGPPLVTVLEPQMALLHRKLEIGDAGGAWLTRRLPMRLMLSAP